ncbi:uncharacterized protein LOC120626321, partial [Pararge aegeria]|uniref:uncharacterized protein LOC120626321 n=1 Tax=Pararge aegeria TaxID=116150 RepID=UPI0019D0444A
MSEGLKEISSHQSNAMQALYYGNNSYDAVKRSYENEKIWNSQQLKNSTHFYGDYLQKRDKGHSRVYHGHDHRIQHDYLYPETINHNSRKYDYTQSTVVNLYMQQDYRKHNVAKQCTRKSDMKGTNYASSEFVPYKCTRRSKSNCHKKNDCMMIKQKCEEQESRTTLLPSSQEFCAYSNPWPPIRQPLKSLDRRKQLKRHYSERKRRVADEEKNFKPFWQMDEYVNSNQPHLKSMRYTTLSNKKNLQNKRTLKRIKTTMKTEPITLTYKERSNSGKRITEKYLSFDELMHLRKLNAEDSGGRRYYDEKQILRESNTLAQTASETTTSPSTKVTPEYSFNTPYIRIKHCTRKLTCTWTAASLTDSAGSIIPGGGGNAVGGSRTPPGYVEGCTRTSTCTRDYMNRNKMATLPIETTSPEPEPGDDEDYCERRSLNKRSNVNSVQGNQNKTSKQNKSFLNESLNNSICYIRNIRTKRQDNIRNLSIISLINRKRETEKLITHETNLLSYGDLYYNVVKKIIEMWKIAKSAYSHDKCLCNDVKKLSFCYLFL